MRLDGLVALHHLATVVVTNLTAVRAMYGALDIALSIFRERLV